MKRFVTGAAVWAVVGLAAYFLLTTVDPPPSAHSAKGSGSAAVVPPPSSPPPPAMLADVVELTDLDPLLDPPVRPVGGVPFDAEPVVPATAAPAPDRIPPSVD